MNKRRIIQNIIYRRKYILLLLNLLLLVLFIYLGVSVGNKLLKPVSVSPIEISSILKNKKIDQITGNYINLFEKNFNKVFSSENSFIIHHHDVGIISANEQYVVIGNKIFLEMDYKNLLYLIYYLDREGNLGKIMDLRINKNTENHKLYILLQTKHKLKIKDNKGG